MMVNHYQQRDEYNSRTSKKKEQIIIYLRKGFFESNSKFEYRVQKALFWGDNDYYTEIRVYPNSVVIVRTLKKEIGINRSKIGFK